MVSRTFGLDIGSTTTKVAWLASENDTYQLNAILISPTPEKGMTSESSLDEDEMVRAIKNIMKESNIKTRYVNIALPENQTYTQVVHMPVLTEKELSAAMYWQAEQYIPVPLTEVIVDYKVLRQPQPTDVRKEMDVLLVGAPIALIAKYERVLKQAGLIVNAIESEILPIIRLLGMHIAPKVSLIVHIGGISSSYAIVQQGVIVDIGSIASGGVSISKAIEVGFGFSSFQAEEYKKTYGLNDPQETQHMMQIIQPVLLPIFTQLKKAITLYTQNNPQLPIQEVIISGGSAKLPGLSDLFQSVLQVQTNLINPWEVIQGPTQLPPDITENGPDYAIALGLAMRPYEA